MVIGIDTSNYTTSIAYFDGENGVNVSKLLPVKQGELGLRQSEAVFAHIKSLPELSDRLFSDTEVSSVEAIGVSTRPRAVEGSYMPCFMVGILMQSCSAICGRYRLWKSPSSRAMWLPLCGVPTVWT